MIVFQLDNFVDVPDVEIGDADTVCIHLLDDARTGAAMGAIALSPQSNN